MITIIILILLSFVFTFLISLPYIKLLYDFNIRRVSKAELDSILPGRQVKLGTPIMGGAVILLSILFWSLVYLRDWEYFPVIVVICVLGGILGGIDEYTNTLGRTIKALRISGGKKYSFIPLRKPEALKLKSVLLKPWQAFEELLRMLGSEQKGLKSHYKLLSHFLLALAVVVMVYLSGHAPIFHFTSWIYVGLGALYFIVMLLAMLFGANAFGVTDGMDGLSAGLHAISFTFMGILAFSKGYEELAILSFIVVGAELAFLYFNIHPARMEMSDVGTLPLGMLLVLIAFLMHVEFALLFIGMIYFIEILSSLIQVWSVKTRGKRVFLVAPIHHHFEKMGWPETKVTMRFWLANVLVGLVGILVALL